MERGDDRKVSLDYLRRPEASPSLAFNVDGLEAVGVEGEGGVRLWLFVLVSTMKVK